MKSLARSFAAAALALAFAAAAPAAHAAGKACKRIPKDKLPETVRVDYARAFGKAPILKCYEMELDGKTLYRIMSKQEKAVVTLRYTSGGVLEEMVEPLKNEDLPLQVIGSIVTRFPRGKIIGAERVTRGKAVVYAVTITQLHHEYREVYDPKGAVLTPARGESK